MTNFIFVYHAISYNLIKLYFRIDLHILLWHGVYSRVYKQFLFTFPLNAFSVNRVHLI